MRDPARGLFEYPQALGPQIVAERGSDAMELLRGAHTTAIQTVIAILNDPMVPARVRLMAADSIIDRVAGKATQRVEAVGVTSSSDPVAEVALIETQLEQSLRAEGWVRSVEWRPRPELGSDGRDMASEPTSSASSDACTPQ